MIKPKVYAKIKKNAIMYSRQKVFEVIPKTVIEKPIRIRK